MNLILRKDKRLYNQNTGERVSKTLAISLFNDGHELLIRTPDSFEDITREYLSRTLHSKQECEFCGEYRQIASGDTVCRRCDKEQEEADIKREKKLAAKAKKRRCRTCQKSLTPNRYFECIECLPHADMESEDLLTEQLDNNDGVTELSTELHDRASKQPKDQEKPIFYFDLEEFF